MERRLVHGTSMENLIEKIVRTRVYTSTYWKEECFALTAESIVDKAVALDHVGGLYGGNQQATQFLCLLLKLLQLGPDKDIILEFVQNEDFKYVRALGAMYVRLVFPAVEVYRILEPLYNDYRKLRIRFMTGDFILSHVDEFIDELLTDERSCGLTLPRIMKRQVLEERGELGPRQSHLEAELLEEAVPAS